MTPVCSGELCTAGYVTVDYPNELKGVVCKAFDSWKLFCALPKEEKVAFSFLEDTHGDGAGYELKEEKGSKKDLKENFHVTLFQYPRLIEIANQRTFYFLHDAKTLLDQIEPLVLQFADAVEKEYGVEGLTEEVRVSKPYWILRYLHYFGDQPEGAEIAIPHIDKGGFTLHLYESDEGLEYYCREVREWFPMPMDAKHTVIISAMQLQYLAEPLKALYHRVVATEQTARTGRFSVVCFVPFENVAKYNKKAHGSTQTHATGFNYDAPHDEFKQLFF